MMLAVIAALALLPQDPPRGTTTVDDVVVEGRTHGPDPLAFFAALCFDGNRLEDRAVRPTDDARWRPIDLTAVNGPGEPGGESFMLTDDDLTLVLNIVEGPDPDRDRVQRNACSLTVVGPHDRDALERRMSALFGGAGTTRHLDFMPAVFPTHPGWVQLAWSSIPSRRSTNWSVFQPQGATEPGFVVVTDPGFYRRSRWIVAELRHGDERGRAVSHISLLHFFRPDEAP